MRIYLKLFFVWLNCNMFQKSFFFGQMKISEVLKQCLPYICSSNAKILRLREIKESCAFSF